VHEQHVQVFLLERPRRLVLPGALHRRRDAVDAELGRAQECAVHVGPFRRDPALVAEHAELRVGARVMRVAREQQRHERLPARVVRLRQRLLERAVVRDHEALRELVDRLPQPVGELRPRLGVLDVLLDELAAVGAERGVEELDRLYTHRVDRTARLAHHLERAHHVLLAPDHVERGQLPQPLRHRLRVGERVGRFLARGQEFEHARRCVQGCATEGATTVRSARAERRQGRMANLGL
jgi:hypothetical protein